MITLTNPATFGPETNTSISVVGLGYDAIQNRLSFRAQYGTVNGGSFVPSVQLPALTIDVALPNGVVWINGRAIQGTNGAMALLTSAQATASGSVIAALVRALETILLATTIVSGTAS